MSKATSEVRSVRSEAEHGTEHRGVHHRLRHRRRIGRSPPRRHRPVTGDCGRGRPGARAPRCGTRAGSGRGCGRWSASQSMSTVLGAGCGPPGRPPQPTAERVRSGDPLLDLGDHLGDHGASGLSGRLRHHRVQPDQGRHQVHVGLHGAEQLRLEQQCGQVQPLDRIPLHHLHHAGREVGADVAQPTGHLGRGGAEPGCSLTGARARWPTGLLLVQRGQGGIHLGLLVAELDAESVGGGLAEQQPPADQPLILIVLRDRIGHRRSPKIWSTTAKAGAASSRS